MFPEISNQLTEMTAAQRYALLEWYYENNGLYNSVAQEMFAVDTWKPGMRPLRNPAYRVVEFYVATIWPGQLPDALPIETENSKIVEPIQQVWTWSNWSNKKQLGSRWFAEYGDLFIKVSGNEARDKVIQQLIRPIYVTEAMADERGFVTYIRIDKPVVENGKAMNHTEEWDKGTQLMRVWVHDKGPDTEIAKLGPDKEQHAFAEFGIDFVPIVHEQFRDIGEERGANAFVHALDKIDEANLVVSRLHSMLFKKNRVFWGLSANSVDGSGRPMPAPRIGSTNSDTGRETLEVGDDAESDLIFRLPGNSTMTPMVPPINYADALNILNAHMTELEQDMPELAYYRVREMGDVSGRAVRLMLGDAIARAQEVRGKAETALARADAMALTMGQSANIEGFKGLGDYAAGDFDHTFARREVIPVTDEDKWDLVKTAVEASVPLTTALKKIMQWTDDEIGRMLADKQTESENSTETTGAALIASQRGFNQGA